MQVLVTGGAGYIGSHAVRELIGSGVKVVVIDDLSNGHREAVDIKAKFINGSTADYDLLFNTLKEHQIDAVMHFAANIEVGESVVNPEKYYANNFTNSLNLLKAMRDANVQKIVFSSTAAVYGNPEKTPIEEDQLRSPINPYGKTKLMTEMAIEDFSKAHGLGYTILRYFNVGGAHPDGTIGEDHEPESHLIPRVLLAARDRKEPMKIFGTDYPTPDGTCVRDYVHVVDLARAHVQSLEGIQPGRGDVFNLGSESGFSVREVIAACVRVTGVKIDVVEDARRLGDPAVLVASSKKIREKLGWKRQYPEIETIVGHAWNWHTRNPNGFTQSARHDSLNPLGQKSL